MLKRIRLTKLVFLEEHPGRNKFLSQEEAGNLQHSCTEHLKPIVMTALNTGMRLGEILNLTWARVHIQNVIDPYIEVTMTKNNETRYVPLDDGVVELLNGLQRRNTHSDFVFLR